MSTFNTSSTPNFDNLLLESLLNRLQIRPPPPPRSTIPNDSDHPLLSSSFEDFLAGHLADSFTSDDEENETIYDYDDEDEDGDVMAAKKKTRLSKEESRLEKEIVKVILTGNTQTLKPNSGQAVSIGDHHVCVGFHEEDGGSGYRVWEWHGHIMLFDDDHGYTPEYIYGNYFERVSIGRKDNRKRREKEEREEKKVENGGLGLKELIENEVEGLGESRVLHCSRNAGSSRVLKGSSEE